MGNTRSQGDCGITKASPLIITTVVVIDTMEHGVLETTSQVLVTLGIGIINLDHITLGNDGRYLLNLG